MVSFPPSGMASTALKTRLIKASRISLSMPATGGRFCPSSERSSITIPRCCGMSDQRARVKSITCCTRTLRSTGDRTNSGLLLAIELAHARHRVRHVADGALRGLQVFARSFAEPGLLLEQHLGVQRYRRNGVVDVVRDSAGHLPQRAQPLLLHHGLLRLAQIVISLLQGVVDVPLDAPPARHVRSAAAETRIRRC